MVTPAARRQAAGHLIETHAVSERRACRVVKLHRSVARYQSQSSRSDGGLKQRMQQLAQQYPRYGYLLLHQFLVQEGLADARRIIDTSRLHYNQVRPHSSLGYVPPE